MDEFDQRWQIGAESARKAANAETPSAPHGFAARVVAHWRAERNESAPLQMIWDVVSRRALACLALALLITAILSWPTGGQSGLAQPELENTVPDLLFTL